MGFRQQWMARSQRGHARSATSESARSGRTLASKTALEVDGYRRARPRRLEHREAYQRRACAIPHVDVWRIPMTNGADERLELCAIPFLGEPSAPCSAHRPAMLEPLEVLDDRADADGERLDAFATRRSATDRAVRDVRDRAVGERQARDEIVLAHRVGHVTRQAHRADAHRLRLEQPVEQDGEVA